MWSSTPGMTQHEMQHFWYDCFVGHYAAVAREVATDNPTLLFEYDQIGPMF